MMKTSLVSSHADTEIPKERWFSHGEYTRRLDAVRNEIARRDLRGLILFSPINIYYLTGHHSIDSWEFRAAVITHDRDPALLLYKFERGRFLASSWLQEAHFYGPSDNPVQILANLITDLGLDISRIGVEQSGPANTAIFTSLAAHLPNIHLSRVERLVERIRLRKSEEEMAYIRRAATFTNLGMRAAVATIREGVVDGEIAAAAAHAMLKGGSENFVMMPTVAVGYRSGISHSEHAHVPVQRHDSVFVELSGCCRHYSCPLMYTTTIGPPSSLWTELFSVAQDVARVVIATAAPGVRACDVASAAGEKIRSVEDRIEFHYNFGYSVGASFPPHWIEDSYFSLKTNNVEPLQTGMVLHVPLTMRILGECAAGTSRTIEITEKGVRVLTGDIELGS